jgi:hypothetical protein
MARARGWKKHPSPNLRDARAHRGPLGKPRLPEWQTAGKMSLMVVEGAWAENVRRDRHAESVNGSVKSSFEQFQRNRSERLSVVLLGTGSSHCRSCQSSLWSRTRTLCRPS